MIMMKHTKRNWGGAEFRESLQQTSETKKPLMLTPRKAPVHMQPHHPTPSSAFTTSLLPDDCRAVTYMLHPAVDENRLRNTLKRRKATDVAIQRAVNELRTVKGLEVRPEEREPVIRQTWSRSDDHWFIINGDGSVSGVTGTPESFMYHPLHRCQAKTSVRLERVQVKREDDPPCEDNASGDAISAKRQRLMMPYSDDSDSSSMDSVPTLPRSYSLNYDDRRSHHRVLPRRQSSLRRFFSRLGQFIRRGDHEDGIS